MMTKILMTFDDDDASSVTLTTGKSRWIPGSGSQAFQGLILKVVGEFHTHLTPVAQSRVHWI